MSRFDQRSREMEIMDDLDCSGPVLEQTLRELKTINRLLGGNGVTNRGLSQVVQRFPQDQYSLVDLGCGGGDMIAVMQAWASKKNIPIRFIGADANANTIALAKERQKATLRIVHWQVANVFDSTFSGRSGRHCYLHPFYASFYGRGTRETFSRLEAKSAARHCDQRPTPPSACLLLHQMVDALV